MTTIKTTAQTFKRDRACLMLLFNIAVHKIANHFPVRLGNLMGRDVLAGECFKIFWMYIRCNNDTACVTTASAHAHKAMHQEQTRPLRVTSTPA